ncbi:hypothetical protein [Deinococcus roseus]|uniref:Fe/B12 periplasmic-binding domain-containing protein n=1 Tax=Deinococcus roseus TaxID=392414 RepID=A0ABQ2CWY6_9DEIO|nr:hypothetical protein [Deinococcus roseus]GGJ29004.1 hypothetical protein GCM10008938_13890 [Deinococcus roseus]
MWSEHEFLLSIDPDLLVMGAEFLLADSEVPALLERCRLEKVLILGFDAFKITPEGHLCPQMEHIYATSQGYKDKAADLISLAGDEIQTYFQEHFSEGTDLYFSFVLEPETAQL